MVSSQLEILGKRLMNVGIEVNEENSHADIVNDCGRQLKRHIEEHQRILE